MRSILGAVLAAALLPSFAPAQEEQRPDEDGPAAAIETGKDAHAISNIGITRGLGEGKNKGSKAATASGGSASGAAGGDAAAGVVPDPKKYRWKAYEPKPGSLDGVTTMPDRPDGTKSRLHGSLYFPSPDVGYAVAFVIGGPKTAGLVSTADEGQVTPTDGTCNFKYWVAKTPGGAPIGVTPVMFKGKLMGYTCYSESGWTGGGLTFSGHPNAPTGGFPLGAGGCAGLAPGKYYAHIVSVWGDPKMKTHSCGLVLGGPMVQMP
jgi:hypothetical protein